MTDERLRFLEGWARNNDQDVAQELIDEIKRLKAASPQPNPAGFEDWTPKMVAGLHWAYWECAQIAGKALGYPWFKDDQKNFPDATEENGVCVGEHIPESIVEELAGCHLDLGAQYKALLAERAASPWRSMDRLRKRLEAARDESKEMADRSRETGDKQGLDDYLTRFGCYSAALTFLEIESRPLPLVEPQQPAPNLHGLKPLELLTQPEKTAGGPLLGGEEEPS